jgi:hypothetical protein
VATIKLTAPSYWASYLINHDASGLSPVEKLNCDDWLRNEGIIAVLDADDAGFCWSFDTDSYSLACDCQTYTCQVQPD